MVSPIMPKFIGMADRVAGHTETVLAVRETRTGKELVRKPPRFFTPAQPAKQFPIFKHDSRVVGFRLAARSVFPAYITFGNLSPLILSCDSPDAESRTDRRLEHASHSAARNSSEDQHAAVPGTEIFSSDPNQQLRPRQDSSAHDGAGHHRQDACNQR